MTPFDMVVTPKGLRFHRRTLPCSLGKGGLTHDKKEGDGATPIGILEIVGMLYRADRITAPTPWAEAIGPRDLWSDDSADSDYNQWVRAPSPYSHEHLRRADPLYDLVLITDWNWRETVPGRGSAIFMHQWRRPGYPTEGCVALSRENLRWVAERITPGTRLIIPSA
ncbi:MULTISPECIES: L,D-transpeptidase family protein [Roseobacteraceae]|nr:L,D-transpeptidase family protein [Phaeobacter gallaeciensis]MBT3141906.1 L,D-transpeptidase family protein [Falsiruegeria litorea]MBT8168747.1 L,D-transpeptidase family protein [Falsiruegeria litorea]